MWFETTRHNVCDQGNGVGFKTYWQTHGLQISGLDNYARSLQLFGLPLTSPRPEKNQAGDTVITQWFERARFEWHPDKPAEFKVLLGLLGNEIRSTKAPATSSIFGVEVNEGTGTATASRMAAAEAGLVRYNGIYWTTVEPTEGARNWGALAKAETDLQAISGANRTPLVIVRTTPAWAQKTAGVECGAIRPEALDAFARFMGDLVRRYSAAPYNVRYWELGNEPDVDPGLVPGNSNFGCWGNAADSDYGGGAYAEMLKRVYPAIKQANPQAQVVIGGLLLNCDPTHPPAGQDCQPARFLEGILRNGGAVGFDFVAYHAYMYWSAGPKDWEKTVPTWEPRGGALLGKLDYLQGILKRYDVVKPILMDEGGLLCYPGTSGCPTPAFLRDQANYAARMYIRGWSHGLSGAIWYTLNGPGWRDGGMLDAQQNPRPTYTTLQFLSSLLKGATYQGPIRAGGVEGYLFRNGAKLYQVAWTNDETTVTMAAPAGLQAVYSLSGQRSNTNAASVQVGFEPVVIEAQP